MSMEDPSRDGYLSTVAYPKVIDPKAVDVERRLRTLTHVLYGLYAAHWLTGGLSALVALIINYVKRADAVGTPYEAHFAWQIRTFWFGFWGYLVGGALMLFLVGWLVLWAVGIWMLYRIIKGWFYLYDNKPFSLMRAWL